MQIQTHGNTIILYNVLKIRLNLSPFSRPPSSSIPILSPSLFLWNAELKYLSDRLLPA